MILLLKILAIMLVLLAVAIKFYQMGWGDGYSECKADYEIVDVLFEPDDEEEC